MARLFLGGRGLGARILWDEVGPEVDPLSPENVLDLYERPADRHRLPDQQPLLGQHQEPADRHRAGCEFRRVLGHAVQKTGYDALIVRGKADKPVYIEIKPDGVTIQDAAAPVGQARAGNHQRSGAEQQQAQRAVHRPGG